MITILNNLRGEFQRYQDQWNATHANTIDLVAFWDVWIRDRLRQIAVVAVRSAQTGLDDLRELAPDGDQAFADGLKAIENWIAEIQTVTVSATGLL
jgi:hypothetical protein